MVVTRGGGEEREELLALACAAGNSHPRRNRVFQHLSASWSPYLRINTVRGLQAAPDGARVVAGESQWAIATPGSHGHVGWTMRAAAITSRRDRR